MREASIDPNPLSGTSGAPLRTCGDRSPQIPPRPARPADPQNDATCANSSHVKGDAGHGSAIEALCRYCEAGLIVEETCRNCGAVHTSVRGLTAEEYDRGADSLESEVRGCAGGQGRDADEVAETGETLAWLLLAALGVGAVLGALAVGACWWAASGGAR